MAVASWSKAAGETDLDVLALVRQVRATIPVVLFSIATSRLRRDLAALRLIEEVDVILNSSDLGLAKPRPRRVPRGRAPLRPGTTRVPLRRRRRRQRRRHTSRGNGRPPVHLRGRPARTPPRPRTGRPARARTPVCRWPGHADSVTVRANRHASILQWRIHAPTHLLRRDRPRWLVAGPDGGDPSGQSYLPTPRDLFEYMKTNIPEALPAPARAALGLQGAGKVFDTVLEGCVSHQLGLDAGMDDAYPHLRHLVFSTTLREVRGKNVELVSTDALERVRMLKQDGSDLASGWWAAERSPTASYQRSIDWWSSSTRP